MFSTYKLGGFGHCSFNHQNAQPEREAARLLQQQRAAAAAAKQLQRDEEKKRLATQAQALARLKATAAARVPGPTCV